MNLNQKNFYYLNFENGSGGKVEPLNRSPKMGIGAVECIMIQKVGEQGTNNSATRLGVEIEKGKSLPLYPDLEELKKIYSYKNFNSEIKDKEQVKPVSEMVSSYENIVDICENEIVIADTNFFNKSKFSVIDLKNLGSWKQDKSWFLGASEYKADYFHVKFLVHLYVLGEWVVKDENIVKFEARPPSSLTKPGIFDYIFPDFKLGFGGRILSVILTPILLLLILSFVFPPLRIMINNLLKRFIY
ncbi:hypothetical protein ACFLQ9_00885 [Bacteroidota bacterium]